MTSVSELDLDLDVFQGPFDLLLAVLLREEISLSEVPNSLLEWQERLAPFGSGNLRPVFVTGGLRIEGSRQIWEGMNLLRLAGGVRAKMAGETDGLPEGAFDAAYTVYRSRYSGQAELEVVDWRQG